MYFLSFAKSVSFVFAIASILLIACLSTGSTSGVPKLIFPHIDKIVHFLMYGGLSFWWFTYIFQQYRSFKRRFNYSILTAVICVTYGGVLEIIQGACIASRSFELLDMLANTLGVCFVLLMFGLYHLCSDYFLPKPKPKI